LTLAKLKKTLYKIFLILPLIILLIVPSTIVAQSSSGDLQAQIDAKNKELEALNGNINNLKSQLSTLKAQANSTLSESAQLDNELKQIEIEQKLNQDEISRLQGDLDLKTLELENLNKEKVTRVKGIYRLNKGESVISKLLSGDSDILSLLKRVKYVKTIVNKDNETLASLGKESDGIKAKQDENRKNIETLTASQTDISKRKSDVEAKIATLNSQISSTNKQASTLQSRVLGIQTSISELQEEQKKALERERTQLGFSTNNNSCGTGATTDPLVSGELYFTGKGRDLLDGHAVGLSEFGAYGAALQGWDYQRILKTYYTGVSIGGDYSYLKVRVSGYGEMPLEDYISGIGEIADYACQTPSNIDKPYSRKDSSSTIWDCWPEEAIKAQLVAARSYVVRYILANPSYPPVATGPSFQVYKGGTNKRWASDATKGQVLLSGSSVISGYFSANGRGHTEAPEYVWTARSMSTSSLNALKGSSKPYYQGVDDSSWTLNVVCNRFTWRTNSYSKAKLSEILARDPITDVGTISSIQTHKGSSQRTWALTVVGSKGTKYIAGWKFKSVFNDWVYNTRVSNKRDFLFSTEFNLNVAP